MAPLLACGVSVPIVYFGVQLASAPFCPDYSFFARDASALGSPESTFPTLFNVAMVLVGLLIFLAACGLLYPLRRLNATPWLPWAIFVAMTCGGVASINGGVFPLPDERHTSGPLAQIGFLMFLLPILMPFAFRSVSSRPLRVFLWTNLAILIGLVPIVSGFVQRVSVMSGVELPRYQVFLNNGHGVLQRIAAAVVLVPIGVVCWHFLTRNDHETDSKVCNVAIDAEPPTASC